MKIRSQVNYIYKMNLCTQFSRATTNRGVFCLGSWPYRVRIMMVSPPKRLLHIKAHLHQRPADRTFNRARHRAFLKQICDHIRCAQGEGKFEGHRIVQYKSIVDPFQRIPDKLGWSADVFRRTKILSPCAAIQNRPPTHRSHTNSQNILNDGRAFLCLNPHDSSLSQLRKHLVIQVSSICFHERRLSLDTTKSQLF